MKKAPGHTNYVIPFSGLSQGEHIFNYNINDSFFKELDYSEIKKGSLSVSVKIEKQSSMLISSISISGYIETPCDRCGEDFNLPIESQRQLIFKTGGDALIEEEEIIYLPGSEHEINFSHHIYESIILGLPARRLHKENEKGQSECNADIIKKLNELSINEETKTDPRWAALKNIKIN